MREILHPPPVPDAATPAPPRKSGCLKAVLVLAGVFLFLLGAIGILVWQSYSWVKNGCEAAPTKHPRVELTDAEDKEASRAFNALWQCMELGVDFDQHFSPNVFNAVVERIIESEHLNNDKDYPPGNPLPTVFLALEGGRYVLHVSVPARDEQNGRVKPNQFYNVVANFDLDVADGVATRVQVHSARLAGREAPFIARWAIHQFTESLKSSAAPAKPKPGESGKPDAERRPLAAIKKLALSGDDIHLVLDGKKMKEQEMEKRRLKGPEAPMKPFMRPQPENEPGKEF